MVNKSVSYIVKCIYNKTLLKRLFFNSLLFFILFVYKKKFICYISSILIELYIFPLNPFKIWFITGECFDWFLVSYATPQKRKKK